MYRSNDALMLVYICNVMIYLWNKLNHYVLIISTIQKPYYRRCDFTMAGFASTHPEAFHSCQPQSDPDLSSLKVHTGEFIRP